MARDPRGRFTRAEDEYKSFDSAELKEQRERYSELCEEWREAQEERAIDMRFLAGDPWEPEDRKAREDAGRPCVSHDELNQFCNQVINGLRQNPRGVKLDALGNGADDKLAEYRQNHIRAIEHRSGAQGAYIAAAENAIYGGYGFFRISRRYASQRSFDQEIVVRSILDPDSVLFDWSCKEPDWGDGRDCFVVEEMPQAEFKRRFPHAKVQSFTPEHMTGARGWVREKTVLVAEYWQIRTNPRRLLLIDRGVQGPEPVFEDELPGLQGITVLKHRQVEFKKLFQQLLNGVEILEESEQPGEYLPIVPVLGKQLYLRDGGQSKRVLISLVRLARDPQMSLAYLNSQQMEEAGLTPKVPYVGYKGQFESDQEGWGTCHKIPRAYLQADPVVDQATGQILPLPKRESFTPNFAQYEVAKDSARRAVQAAMGISPLPTAAQRNNEKSGVALQRIAAQQAMGSYHFSDNYDRGLRLGGKIINQWIPVTYDTPRDVPLRKADDTHLMVRANDPGYVNPVTRQIEHYDTQTGEFDVTVSTGPSHESQRAEASEFLDTLITNLQALPVMPAQAAKLLALAIQMKQLGPRGDQMAEIISPGDKQELPPQAQAALQQAKQQLQSLNEYAKDLETKLAEMKKELEGKRLESQTRLQVAAMQEETKRMIADLEARLKQIELRAKLAVHVDEQEHEAGMQERREANEQAAARGESLRPPEA